MEKRKKVVQNSNKKLQIHVSEDGSNIGEPISRESSNPKSKRFLQDS